MIRKRLLAVPLCLALLLTALLPVYLPGAAEGFVKRTGILFEPKELPPGVNVTKTVSPAPNYKVKIEAYVENGNTELNGSSVIKDVVSTYFNPPTSAAAKISTRSSESDPWSEPTAASITPTVSGGTVSVTGFDFEINKKLIIEYNITPKTGFLGGNKVPTDDGSGVYTGADSADPLGNFSATADVPVPEITVEPLNKNVYLYGTVTDKELLEGAEAYVKDVGGNILAIGEADSADWRDDYVKITTKIYYPDSAAQHPAFTGDTVYNFNVKVEPIYQGTAGYGGGAKALNIFVYKPKVTFKDLEVYYGANADLSAAKAQIEWLHNGKSSEDMTGNAPTIDFTYSVDGVTVTPPVLVNSPEDKYVKVTEAKIDGHSLTNDEIEYAHQDCDPNCGYDATNGQFMLHVKTCTLTITKNFEGNPHSVDKSFLFTIKSDTNNSVQINDLSVMLHIIDNNPGSVTIEGLPVGIYTVTEDSVMAWRYTGNNPGSCTLTANAPMKTVTVTNKITKTRWITFADFIDNLFGAAPGN